MEKIKRRFLNALILGAIILFTAPIYAQQADGAPGVPYPNMPSIAPIGVQTGRYMEVNESAKGPAIDPAKGYRIQEFGKGLYMVTDNAIQSMFMVYEKGVVIMDVPENLASFIPKAIAEVTNKPVTHLIYTHWHADHIGGTGSLHLNKNTIIIAQEETKKLLVRAADPARPVPTFSFKDQYTLKAGSQTLELSYHGNAHVPGNTFIYAPAQRTLMVIDVIFPGWMP
jgi:glyoxylase-like metal-dependent hydrolase (beta-lactamase superfamily II)